jgi:predicted amidohydrolase YtcJ
MGRRSKLFFILIFFLSIAFYFIHSYIKPAPPYKQAYLNGKILTMNKTNTIAQAVLIERNKIIAVGTNHKIQQLINKETLVHDLKGKTMIPGIIDSHGHFPGQGLSIMSVDLNSPPIGKVKTINQALKLLRKKALKTPKGKWILGYGYDDTLLKEKRHFTRSELDKVSLDHPIYTMHISAHFGVANSLALKLMGVSKKSPDPPGGTFSKDPLTGELTGLLLEAAHVPFREKATDFSLWNKLRIVKAASDQYIAKGVTTAQNGLAIKSHITGLSLASKIGITPLRLVTWPDEKLGMKIIRKKLDFSSKLNEKFLVGAIKLVADGSIQGYTGFLSRPYHKGPKGYRGHPTTAPKKLKALVKEIHRAGYQMAIHGNGDAAIDLIIDAYSDAQKLHYRKDARPIIIHAQMLRNDQIDRMKKLGMTASFFAAHTYYWGDRHRDIFLGPKRSMRISPTKTTLNKGVPFTLHLDSPVVPMDPMLMVWNAVNRLTASGKVLGKNERISVITALRAITINAAWQIFQEDNRGSIEVGKFADMVILSNDPLKNPRSIKDIQVEKTIIGGVPVYNNKSK